MVPHTKAPSVTHMLDPLGDRTTEVVNIDEEEVVHRPTIPIPYVPFINPYEFIPERFLDNQRNQNEMIESHVIDTAALLLEHYDTGAFQANPAPQVPQRPHINAVLSFSLTPGERL